MAGSQTTIDTLGLRRAFSFAALQPAAFPYAYGHGVAMDYPFTTDGCSGGMTAAWLLLFKRVPPWNDLCIAHDYIYWRGGTAKQRRAADRQLRSDVATRGYPKAALLMWIFVRIGGHPLLPLPWRWGYGWRWPHGYTS